MTYALAHALQSAIFARLSSDATVSSLVSGHVHDALPPGPLPPLYVALGPETARDRSDGTSLGAEHDLTVSVVSNADGFAGAKKAAAAICDALLAADLPLSRGRLVFLRFVRAQAVRASGGARRIDITFRARVEDAGA